jgi:hypothetical protein
MKLLDEDENAYRELIDERENFFENLAEDIEPHLPTIKTHILNFKISAKPLSHFSLFSMFPRIESIRLGIYASARINESYSSNILFRSLLQHTIKFNYLFMKTISLTSDEVGIDYWTFGNRQENIDYMKNLAAGYALFGINPAKPLLEIFKELGIVSADSSQSAIKQRAEQFQFKKMVRYITDQTVKKKDYETSTVLQFFPLYSELSSFVHGGPQSISKTRVDVKTAIDISSVSSLSARHMHMIAGYQYDKQLHDVTIICKKYLDDYQAKFTK